MQEETQLIRQWHPAIRLATPETPLVLRLQCGKEVTGTRPAYIAGFGGDLGYQTSSGQPVTPVAWAYE